MLIPTSTKIINLDGATAVDKMGKELTLRNVLINSILFEGPNIRSLDAVNKLRAYRIAQKIQVQDEVDLTKEDVDLIKEGMVHAYNAIVYGQVSDLFDDIERVEKETQSKVDKAIDKVSSKTTI
jgi:hypothetical protein